MGAARMTKALVVPFLTLFAGCAAPATQVILLGTGTPNADPDRSGPAVAVVVNETPYLVDCGPGIVRRAAAAKRNGVTGLDAPNLERVFITHLHSDHTLGLPDLIFTPWVLGRDTPLEIYGPPGTSEMAEHLVAAYRQDIRIRIDGLEPANPNGYQVNVHEIEPGIVYRDDNVIVKAFPVRHGSWKHAFGYRFETADRTIVISGDTAPCQSLIDHAEGCDILIHEVYSAKAFKERPPEWQRYHAAFHTSTKELAEIATQVRPGLLVLTHQLFWGKTEADLLAEVRESYDGPVVSGRDLDKY
ncbi:MAG: MBL fold metallo-hydrolase [Planctomycetota bacterium]|nr:MBL fold metallo-hydrolase [Planctomycetota bacterium]